MTNALIELIQSFIVGSADTLDRITKKYVIHGFLHGKRIYKPCIRKW